MTHTMTSAAGRIAAVVGTHGATAQALLAEMVAEWRDGATKIAGVIAEGHGLVDRTCGAGFLRDIASGTPYRIYLDEAPDPASCHLDCAGVAGAAATIVEQIAASDLVVLNKFGKLEAMGKGLAPALARAIATGKPLLTTVSDKHRDAWGAFAPDALSLAADKTVLRNWWRAMQDLRQRQADTRHAGSAGDYAGSAFR